MQGLKLDIARRPIHIVFRALQRSLAACTWQRPIGNNTGTEKSVALFFSTLNYSTLKSIGKIRLDWVNSLSSHLDFDPGTRTLYVFRFPTLCVLSILKTKNSVILEGKPLSINCLYSFSNKLARALYKTDNDAREEFEMGMRVNQEVLMSYRLLFAQTISSRSLAKSILETLRDREDPICDSFLEDLCTRPYDRKIEALPPSLWLSRAVLSGTHCKKRTRIARKMIFPCMAAAE